MIIESLQTVVAEVNGLWTWVIGIVAGWGLTFTIVVAALVYAHIRLSRLNRKLEYLESRIIAEGRDVSLRLTKVEK